MSTHKRLRDILDAEIDFESPIDEDFMTRLVKNMYEMAQMIDGTDEQTFKASANGNPVAGLLTIDTITSGVFVRDDQYNTSWILVTSGTASGNGVNSRFPITDSDEGAQTFTCGDNGLGEDLATAGMLNNDTFKVLGHVHDGSDGELIDANQIDFTNLELGLKEYTASGKSKNSSTTAGTDTDSHTLTGLPTGDVMIWITFKLLFTNVSNTDIDSAIKSNGQEVSMSGDQVSTGTGDGATSTGTWCVIVQNGDQVSSDVQSNAAGTAYAEFDVIAYQSMT